MFRTRDRQGKAKLPTIVFSQQPTAVEGGGGGGGRERQREGARGGRKGQTEGVEEEKRGRGRDRRRG